MLKDITLGQYFPIDSPLHRMDPRTKIILLVFQIVLIFLASFLTGVGLYDRIGVFAGAGSIVPITGFSNSITSPAVEFKKEGIIFGLCVKMFSVAGPVIVNGTVISIIVGVIYLFL